MRVNSALALGPDDDDEEDAAWELADELTGSGWSTLTLPVDGEPTPFYYRESEYGWVLAGTGEGVFLGAYGRGIAAGELGFGRVGSLLTYDDPAGSGVGAGA